MGQTVTLSTLQNIATSLYNYWWCNATTVHTVACPMTFMGRVVRIKFRFWNQFAQDGIPFLL
jgi:hypothetical protein